MCYAVIPLRSRLRRRPQSTWRPSFLGHWRDPGGPDRLGGSVNPPLTWPTAAGARPPRVRPAWGPRGSPSATVAGSKAVPAVTCRRVGSCTAPPCCGYAPPSRHPTPPLTHTCALLLPPPRAPLAPMAGAATRWWWSAGRGQRPPPDYLGATASGHRRLPTARSVLVIPAQTSTSSAALMA